MTERGSEPRRSPGELVRELVQTAFRMLPWPTEPGLRRVGQPGPSSPVVVTGNYDLTVRRLMRALAGLDVWVVVAPSSGINVWCAASGGHLGTSQVVTALKTSGIEKEVIHHRAILPQLAATGVEGLEVSRRCGWKVRFGPVYAEDLPRFLAAEQKKSDDMRHVRFSFAERMEMAIAWAAPTALVVGAVALLLRPPWALPLVVLCAALSAGVFLFFDRLPEPRRTLLGAAALAIALPLVAFAGGGVAALAAAAGACLLLTALLTYDYTGSTPLEGGSHFEDRRFEIELDLERCRGVYSCWEVCPRACFEKPADAASSAPGSAGRKIALAYEDRCIRCGACIVQCPMDALAFQDASGARVEPDTIRRYKLNLLGRRTSERGAD